MKVVWTESARQDRIEILDYIAADNRTAAARMNRIFREAAASLAEHPKIGKEGELPGTREIFPHPSYRLVYEVDKTTVWVLMLIHTARQWPPVRE
ncbi:MAG: type II toxin-antitoxin system RelE/ParE family toxin [Azonexus sp.]|nr:type II toxin-antitoxin system RelE/ParE family toxin [Azonexus sp.]